MATTKAKKKKPKKRSAVLNVDGVEVPVTFNTTGRLDKKSQKAFNEVLNKKLQSGLASRFSMSQGVEALGFGGLVWVWYVGGDVLSGFLGGLPGDVVKALSQVTGGIVETPADAATLLVGGIAGLGIKKVIDDPGILLDLLRGQPFVDLAFGTPEKIVKESLAAPLSRTNGQRLAQIAAFEKALAELEAGERDPSTLIMPRRGTREVPERARTIVLLQERIERLKSKTMTEEEEIAAAKKYVSESTGLLKAKKIAFATGMAYVTKKFLENYTFSQFIENTQFL